MFKKGKFVRCVNNSHVSYMTLGKDYEILGNEPDELDVYVKIVNDKQYTVLLLKSRFVLTDNPSVTQAAEEYEEIMKLQELIHG